MLRQILLCINLLLLPFCPIYGQGENNVWTFGHNNGLNFNNSPPSAFSNSNVSLGTSASVSDAAGNLLFYSNGYSVWDAAGNVMPNGSGILGYGSGGPAAPSQVISSQGVQIVQSVNSGSQYYLFTIDAFFGSYPQPCHGYFRYSIIDMTLNGGMGDVVPGQKNILVDSAVTEKMAVIKGAGCYYWILNQQFGSSTFRAYKLDAAGIHPPVLSTGTLTCPPITDPGFGFLASSPDGTKIANCNAVTPGLELGTFDHATGLVSNTAIIDPAVFIMGLCFSPDNSKLYQSALPLEQFDLSAFPNYSAITASKTIVSPFTPFGYEMMRMGPDGKIYCRCFNNYIAYLGVLNNPNLSGTASNFTVTSMGIFANDTSGSLGNNALASLLLDTTFNKVTDTLICTADTFRITAPADYNNYLWNDGSTSPARDLTADGTYWVYSFQGCSALVDSVTLKFEHLAANLGPDTAICPGAQLTLDVTTPGATYRWQDNSTGPTFEVMGSGIYSVSVSRNTCSVADTLFVQTLTPEPRIAEGDTTICTGKSITLHALTNIPGGYIWNTGDMGSSITTSEPGTYTVHTYNVCGDYAISVVLDTRSCSCVPFIPNVFSPNGDGLNDVFSIQVGCHVTQFDMSIYNRYGQCVYRGAALDKGWDGTFNGRQAAPDTYFYHIHYYGPQGENIEKRGDLTLIR